MTKPDYSNRREQFLEQPLPSSEDAERVILGAVLLDNTLFAQVAEKLKAEHFYSPLNRRIFWAMSRLFETGKKIDPILIGEEMKKEGSIDSIGGITTITNLTYGLPHFSSVEAYITTVYDYAQVRELIRTCNCITSEALAGEEDAGRILEHAQALINEVTAKSQKVTFHKAKELGRESMRRAVMLAQRGYGDRLTGVPTGYQQFDHVTNGLQKTDLIVLGGRPSMGKSALAGCIAVNSSAALPGCVVAVFTMEMSKEQYIDRMIGSMASVNITNYRKGVFTESEWIRVTQAQARLESYNIEIDDSGGLTTLEMKSKLLTLHGLYRRLDLVLVDFLQKMHPSVKTDSRQQEVSRVAQDLKNIAKDFKVPVVALSSLSRGPETRKPPKPLMSDLRESGDIESEADVIGFLYRDNFYNPRSNPADVELNIVKNRNGDTPLIKLNWLAEFTRFEDIPSFTY